jgi:hypothetical protein
MIRLLCLVMLASPALGGRVSTARTVDALAAESTAVVHGTVTAAASRKVRHAVRTEYTIAPMHALSGIAPESIVMELPGGHLDGVTIEATGVPVWSVGDEVVVFLSDGRPTSLDGLLTIDGGIVHDPQHRPAMSMPTSLTTLAAAVAPPRPSAAD